MEANFYKLALDKCIEKIKINIDSFVHCFPDVSKNNIYIGKENELWTSSFWPGIVYLAYECTRDPIFMKYKDIWLKSFEERLESKYSNTHDLGFLYTLSCVSLFKIEENQKAKILALKAADRLVERYNEEGKYIKAWETETASIDLMIDTMMNIPLLFWASEDSKDKKYEQIALNHSITTAESLIREDSSTYHICPFEFSSGKILEGKTFQGLNDDSTWARGQAWAIYGFSICYKYTKDIFYLNVAEKLAEYFINNNKSEDYIPYWDLYFEDCNPDLKDSSAGSIAACGLIELSNQLGDNGIKYIEYSKKMIKSLYENYFTGLDNDSNGLLLHGVYHRNIGADECTIWGDYFYIEALMRINNVCKIFW